MTRFKLGIDVPVFKIRWRGYDRAEVEEYLRETRLREFMARLDVPTGGGQPSEELEVTRQRLAVAEAELAALRAERDEATESADRRGSRRDADPHREEPALLEPVSR